MIRRTSSTNREVVCQVAAQTRAPRRTSESFMRSLNWFSHSHSSDVLCDVACSVSSILVSQTWPPKNVTRLARKNVVGNLYERKTMDEKSRCARFWPRLESNSSFLERGWLEAVRLRGSSMSDDNSRIIRGEI